MNIAIEILENELESVKKLKRFQKSKDKKIQELTKAIEILKKESDKQCGK